MHRDCSQYVRLECDVMPYYEDLDKLDFMYIKLKEVIDTDANFGDWVDVVKENDFITLKGETEYDVYVSGGCPGTFWEPPEPPEFEGMITKQEMLELINKAVNKANIKQFVSYIEDVDSYCDDEEEILES